MNSSIKPAWRKAKSPLKRRKLNDHAYRSNPSFENESLPIHSRRLDIMTTLASTQVLIVQGDTGCGKTTQLPKFILSDYPNARIAVTQPRRIAAVGVARRVARELNTSIGDLVGYHIRGEKSYKPNTQIVFMTTGMFIQELVGNNTLDYTHIILDEVHERAIETEFLLVVLKHMLYKSNTKLILMSATIDAKLFANYFAESEIQNMGRVLENKVNSFNLQPNFDKDRDDAAPIRVAGPRNFSVKEIYLDEILSIVNDDLNLSETENEEIASYFKSELVSIDSHFYRIAAHLIRTQHLVKLYEESQPQTFLIFLPGIHEIAKMGKVLAEEVMRDHGEEIEICMLHSSIPEESHGNIFKNPEGKRRVIISTNIAESSITLPDVRYIIDFGLTKELVFNSVTKCERLQMQWACKAVMQQRAGRAGRVAEGVCFRLMPEVFYNSLKPHSIPEIQRCPLDKLVLKVKQLNLGTPQEILGRAIQPPDMHEVILTENYLKEMGALNEENNLTWLGKVYADMPCDVKISRLCLFGYIFNCIHDALSMGSILSQEKSVFISCAHLEYKHSSQESFRYAKKLMWDQMRDSDPIAALSAFKSWNSQFGKFFTKNLKKKTFARTSRQEVPINEKNWCKSNALDYNVLREVCVTYQELKRRLKFMGLAKQHLACRLQANEESILVLKLCIAAAYNEKYLISFFAFEDEVMRRKKEQMLKERQVCKVMIPGIPNGVGVDDIRKVLVPTRGKNVEIEIDRETAIITFDPSESIRPLQMCIWLGTFPQRYRCGNFVVCKKYLLDKNKNIQETLEIENLPQVLQKVAYSQPREGMKIEVESSKLTDRIIHVEAHCLHKPEYIYKLNFQDFLTGAVISLDDLSVCKVVIEDNPSYEKCHMAVCCELVEKRNRTLATNVTLMPTGPLVPHILTLLFTRNVALYEHKSRYGGILVNKSPVRFAYTFTGKDIEDINEIRKQISEALFDEKGILNPAPLNVKEKIFKLLNKKRLPYVDDKFRNLIRHAEEYEQHPGNDENIHLAANGKPNYGVYLEPIQKICTVKEDFRNWTEEGQRKIELEMLEIRAMKEELVLRIKHKARISKITRPELMCEVCKSTICAYFNVIPIEVNPGSGKFKLNCIFGSIRYEQDLNEGMGGNEFLTSLTNEIIGLEEWGCCMEGHLVGWKAGGACYINHKSPVSVLMPSGEEMKWGSYLWQEGYNEFLSICKASEISSTSKTAPKRDLSCEICQVTYETPTEFFNHVIVNKEHTDNVTRFLREGY